jgi:hypothetical protein
MEYRNGFGQGFQGRKGAAERAEIAGPLNIVMISRTSNYS